MAEQDRSLENAKRVAKIVENACMVECRVTDLQSTERSLSPFCTKCMTEQLKHFESVKCESLMRYAVYQAEKWGGKYEFLCPAGCAFVAVSLPSGSEVKMGILAGPMLMVDIGDFTSGDLELFFKGSTPKILAEEAKKLTAFSYKRVPYLTDMMFMLTSYLSERAVLDLQVMEFSDQNRSEIFSSISKIKESGELYKYPIEIEKMLQMYITQGDRAAAQMALNDILGHIYFSSGGDFSVIKSRVIELIVLLSRAAIEGGAGVGEVFGINCNYFSQINAFENMDQLNDWLSRALIRFTNTVFVVSDTKHSEIIKRVMDYIRQNCTGKITLNDISDYVNFSVSYLSRIFKEETGENISSYINRMRVERSKILLLNMDLSLIEVAFMSGFDDQSYFNKVFKKLCGATPGKFREKRGKV